MNKKEQKQKFQGRLGFNENNGRYGLLISDLWEKEGFHCGDCLEVLENGKWVKTHMEMSPDEEWYLEGTSYYSDLEYVKARIWR